MTEQAALDHEAARTFSLLNRNTQILVTAESCTAGLITATLARVPGMSARLAGGFVSYQIASKVEWLGILPRTIEEFDVVSAEVAAAMSVQALRKTPQATVSLSITGHLGPDAPVQLDGIAWISIAVKSAVTADIQHQESRLILHADVTNADPDAKIRIRRSRQQDAVLQALQHLNRFLTETA